MIKKIKKIIQIFVHKKIPTNKHSQKQIKDNSSKIERWKHLSSETHKNAIKDLNEC